MSDPGKVMVAMSFFATITYIVRLLVLRVPSAHAHRERSVASGVVVDDDRMARLEQAVEAIALEVERISEGQRFTTKLLAERARAELATPARQAATPDRITPH